MSIKEKILLLQYYNPTIKIEYKEWKVLNKKNKIEIRAYLTPTYLWEIINRM